MTPGAGRPPPFSRSRGQCSTTASRVDRARAGGLHPSAVSDAPDQLIVHFRDCEEPLRFPNCVALLAGDRYLIVEADTQEIETRIAVEAVERIDPEVDVACERKPAEVVRIADYRRPPVFSKSIL